MNFIAQIRSKTTIWWRRALCRSSLEEETDAESHTISHGLPLTETNDVEQTRRRSASRTRFFGPRRAESRSAIARYAQYGAQPIIRANHVILWTLRLLVSPIFTPMVTAHKKRLARSYPSANDVHMAAVLWLLETSTDPEIHVNSMLVAPDVIWTDAMFRSLFPVETLDLYLKQVAACFQGGRLKADSVDQVLSSCSSFLRVFWRMCQIDRGQATTDAWSRTSGATFVETYPAIMTALQSVELKDYARPAGEVWILRYMHLTLEHLCDASKPQNALISVNFPAETSSGASQLKNTTLSPNAPFTASFQFRTSNLLYLSYLSFQHAWVVPHCIVLLSEIQEYSASGGSSVDVQHFSLLATALLLGFEPTGDLADFLVTPEWSRQRGWRAAADYVLTELYSFLQWKWSGPRETPSIAWVFVVSKYDRLGSESLIVLTKIIHILRFATEILSKTWVMPSFYSAPLTVFATKLCSSRDTVGLEAVCQGVTDVMMLLSRTVEHAGYQDFDANEALRVILETAATLRLSSTGRLTRPAHPPHSDSFFLMQQTAFSIIQSSIARGHYRPTDVPSFSTDTCRWEVSHPGALDVSTIGEEDHVRISERDFSFIAVICAIKEATDSSDRADACTWFEDVQSVPLMRLWARIAHCWLIPIKSDAFSSEKVRRLSLEMLLDCERFRLPERSTWGEDLSVVQQVAFVTLWKNWATALARAAAGQDVDFSKLAESTRCVLAGMEMRDAAELEWYIRDTLEDTFPRQLMDIRERGVVDPSLAVVESLLAEKLDEIQRFKNTGLDGVRDTVNKIKKHTNISVVGKVPDERHTASSRKEQEEVQAPVVLDALDARETSMANTEGSDVVGKVENEVRSADCT
ncbi:hypothetical protein BXZ70DRAFT_634967 [Cristinia sonorae]|uniref:Uncharacterized protein n=1 Tax=Cristinia sonorae TaxID=1940300 RepID=A0A8K0UEH6_9AGAR|nr:hypothetical protein BXZ70DRAFT_634967 [Cristinia sonorae]